MGATTMIDVNEARTRVEAAGFRLRECEPDIHWQVVGGVKPVNIHLRRRGGATLYMSGAMKSTDGGGDFVGKAIAMASGGESVSPERIPRQQTRTLEHAKWRKKKRRQLYGKSQKCRWCGRPLTFEQATLDHVIPMAKGGSDRDDNLCIACQPCNATRADKAIHPHKPKPFLQPAFAEHAERVAEIVREVHEFDDRPMPDVWLQARVPDVRLNCRCVLPPPAPRWRRWLRSLWNLLRAGGPPC